MHIQLLIILLVHVIPGDAYNDIIVKLIYVFVDLWNLFKIAPSWLDVSKKKYKSLSLTVIALLFLNIAEWFMNGAEKCIF